MYTLGVLCSPVPLAGTSWRVFGTFITLGLKTLQVSPARLEMSPGLNLFPFAFTSLVQPSH